MTIFLAILAFALMIGPLTSLWYARTIWKYAPAAYIKWLIFSPLATAIYILTYLLSPILAAVSVIFNWPVLPWPFNLFHTNDADLDGGQYQLGWPVTTGWRLWWYRMLWIQRNPAYGFDTVLFGFPYKTVTKTTHIGIGAWDSGSDNFELVVIENERGQKMFSIRWQKYYLFNKMFIRIWIGWNHHWLTIKANSGSVRYANNVHPFRTST